MKHKHAELIHAWADGARIQTLDSDTWVDVPRPSWGDGITYRIKPEEKKSVVKYLWAHRGQVLNHFASEAEVRMNKFKADYKRLDWSRTEFEE